MAQLRGRDFLVRPLSSSAHSEPERFASRSAGDLLPERLRRGIEGLSGLPMHDVRVRYHSPEPGRLNAHAYTRGHEIHVAPGQERHLAHEAWHVVQQKQGRVPPSLRIGDVGANDDPALEREADAMGARATGRHLTSPGLPRPDQAPAGPAGVVAGGGVVQRFPVTAKWGPVNKQTGGSWMEAVVGADDEWVYGSKPKANTPTIIKNVGKIVGGKRRYIAGHLLNDNLGGEGINKNLTVLSSKANKKHTGIESKVKTLGIKAGQIKRGAVGLGDPTYEHGAKYKVTVLAAAPGGAPPHHPSERKLASGLRIDLEPVRKKGGVFSPWPEEAGSALVNHVVDNVPPYPAAPQKGTATAFQREIIAALVSLKPVGGSSLISDIRTAIDTNRGAAGPAVRPHILRMALRKGEEKQLWKINKGRVKLTP